MHLYSMTGYGRAEATITAYRVRIEIKSLNGKFMELNLRVPRIFSFKEIEIRKLLTDKLQRGSVSVFITLEKNFENAGFDLLNKAAIAKYHRELTAINQELGLSSESLLQAILQLPEVTEKDDAEELSEEEWKKIQSAFEEACAELAAFRQQEGVPLKKHLEQCNENILQLLKEVEKYEPERTESIRQRIASQLENLAADVEADKNRFEQEMIYYIEKLDINEEKQRLLNHCNYFKETLAKEPSGKKLSFIAQEMGREINTIGSKSNHFKMQQIVIQMKDELEKIKEQVNNVL